MAADSVQTKKNKSFSLLNKEDTEKEKNFSDLTLRQQKLYQVALDIIDNDPTEIGFVCRSMVSASMPHSRVKGDRYKRQNNNFTLEIIGNEEAGGVPYGTYPRLILSWIASEVIKSGSREIILGHSLSDFMKKLGLHITGGRWGTVPRFKEQLKRLFSSYISFTYIDKSSGQWVHANMNIADRAYIFWNPHSPESIDLFKSKVFLGEAFYNEIKKTPIPVDIRAINGLKDSSLALDIYFWLTYRISYLKSPIDLSYEKLQIQFGAGYENTKQGRYDFKRKFNIQLKRVLTIYPNANVEVKDNALYISPSKTHISKNSLKNLKIQEHFL